MSFKNYERVQHVGGIQYNQWSFNSAIVILETNVYSTSADNFMYALVSIIKKKYLQELIEYFTREKP